MKNGSKKTYLVCRLISWLWYYLGWIYLCTFRKYTDSNDELVKSASIYTCNISQLLHSSPMLDFCKQTKHLSTVLPIFVFLAVALIWFDNVHSIPTNHPRWTWSLLNLLCPSLFFLGRHNNQTNKIANNWELFFPADPSTSQRACLLCLWLFLFSFFLLVVNNSYVPFVVAIKCKNIAANQMHSLFKRIPRWRTWDAMPSPPQLAFYFFSFSFFSIDLPIFQKWFRT